MDDDASTSTRNVLVREPGRTLLRPVHRGEGDNGPGGAPPRPTTATAARLPRSDEGQGGLRSRAPTATRRDARGGGEIALSRRRQRRRGVPDGRCVAVVGDADFVMVNGLANGTERRRRSGFPSTAIPRRSTSSRANPRAGCTRSPDSRVPRRDERQSSRGGGVARARVDVEDRRRRRCGATGWRTCEIRARACPSRSSRPIRTSSCGPREVDACTRTI